MDREVFLRMYRRKAKLTGCEIDEDKVIRIFKARECIRHLARENPGTECCVMEKDLTDEFYKIILPYDEVRFFEASFYELAKDADEYWISIEGKCPVIILHFTGIVLNVNRYYIPSPEHIRKIPERKVTYTDILDMSLISLKNIYDILPPSEVSYHNVCDFLDKYGKYIYADRLYISPNMFPMSIDLGFTSKLITVGYTIAEEFACLSDQCDMFRISVNDGKLHINYSNLPF